MDVPIQAKSLASLNELADNPPSELSPQLRRSVKGELTLYIARVPGSRDVFLTTMKPRDKVVTAQDVESSLYYCHLETAEDQAIRASMQSNESETSAEHAAPAASELLQPPSLVPDRLSLLPSPPATPDPKDDFLKIPRKPVSPDPEDHTDEYLIPQPLQPRQTPPRSASPANSASSIPTRSPAIRRKPVGGHQHSRSLPPPFPRRPAGPRPMSKGDDLPIPVHTMNKENIAPSFESDDSTLPLRRATDEEEQPPPLPLRNPRRNTDESPTAANFRQAAPPPLQLRRATDMSSGSMGSGKSWSRPGSESSEDSMVTSKDFIVTVIRRDPGTGTQWNIGRLTKDGTQTLGSSGNKVALEICSGAYDKFNDETSSSDDDNDTYPAFTYRPFTRDLHLRQRRKSNALSPRPSPSFRTPTDLAAASTQRSRTGGPEHDASGASPFSFTSPWKGSCDFSTGVGGRTMRCRHLYPPAASGTGTGSGAAVESRLAVVNSSAISELRFNLPVYKKRRSAKHRPTLSAQASRTSFDSRLGVPGSGGGGPHGSSSGGGNTGGGSRPGAFLRRHGHSRWTRSIDATEREERGREEEMERGDAWDETTAGVHPRLDLSLGREYAGGGLAGNKAKLGKLIVEGDGMLMLDLVVLANLGLWWSVASQ